MGNSIFFKFNCFSHFSPTWRYFNFNSITNIPMDPKPTILQIKRKREESYHDTIILERPTKIPNKKGNLIDDLKALSMNQPAPAQKVFRFLASTAEVGQHFLSNDEKMQELLKKRKDQVFQTPQQETQKRKDKQEDAAKAARSQQINKIRTLSTLSNPQVAQLLELSVVPPAPSKYDLKLPVVRRMTDIFDENDYVTHYYYLDEKPSSGATNEENAMTYPVESFDFGENEYDEEEGKYEDSTESEIDYPSEASEDEDQDFYNDNEKYMTHAYDSNEEYGPEDSYSLD